MPLSKRPRTQEEHRARHQLLYSCFTELLDDYMRMHSQQRAEVPSLATLARWAKAQTVEPEGEHIAPTRAGERAREISHEVYPMADKKVDDAIERAGRAAGADKQRIDDVKEIAHELEKEGIPGELLAETAREPFADVPGAAEMQHEAAEQTRREKGDASPRSKGEDDHGMR